MKFWNKNKFLNLNVNICSSLIENLIEIDDSLTEARFTIVYHVKISVPRKVKRSNSSIYVFCLQTKVAGDFQIQLFEFLLCVHSWRRWVVWVFFASFLAVFGFLRIKRFMTRFVKHSESGFCKDVTNLLVVLKKFHWKVFLVIGKKC